MARTLRSKKLRALLWQAADGKCRSCGDELGEDWQVDHIVPWAVEKRTNVHEMQALCADCNRKKGAKMVGAVRTAGLTELSGIDLEYAYSRMRFGQREALRTGIDRVITGETHTSVVLPTRYGKTDVARLWALYLKEQRSVATTLLLVPSDRLRKQVARKEKWDEALSRYRVRTEAKVRQVVFPEGNFNANGETMLVSTIQLVQRNIDIFSRWVESVRYRQGLPVLVIVDEAHTGSEDNTWGDAVNALVKFGAQAILMTATAFRSDGRTIPGFKWDILTEKDVAWRKGKPADDPDYWTWEYMQGVDRAVRLRADWETTFRQAWDEKPSPLCKLSRVPFDIKIMTAHSTNGEVSARRDEWLSEKSVTDARRVLGKLVRDPQAIREGTDRLVNELHRLRQVEPTAGGIVFCGNDEDGDSETNHHARQIEKSITRIDPSFNVVIATSNQGKYGTESIDRFVDGGAGDVLIVKQMGGVGTDCPRLKVCLDLSSIRTGNASIQRWMRVATPFNGLRVGVLICPDDALGREHFQALISSQGGEFTVRTGDVVRTEDVPRPSGDEEKTRTDLVDITGPGDFDDSEQNRAEREKQEAVRFLLGKFPEMASLYTHAEIAVRWGDGRPEQEDSGAVDLTAQLEDNRMSINGLMDTIVKSRRIGKPYDQLSWGQDSKDAWTALYREAGVPVGTKLERINDLKTMSRVRVIAQLMWERECRHEAAGIA